MAVISIARQYGAGASVIGRRLAERLGYRLVDRSILDEIATKANVSVKKVVDIEKMTGDWFISFLSELFAVNPSLHVPGFVTDFDEGKYFLFLKRAIAEIASKGNAVVIGRGGQFVLKDNPKAIRVYLVAEEEFRIKNLMKVYGVGREKAQTVAHRDERKRLAFLEKFGNGHHDDPLLYHIVVNTTLVSFDSVVDFVSSLVSDIEQRNLAVPASS